ncbi:MAG: YebC/PmpR family DNA-binding transcriptional regulator [Candidatus Paceibacterota bacterium]
MSGHNKWSKIKRKKEKLDKERSKEFSKLVDQIQVEAKRCGGDMNDAGLQQAIEQAKAANMPKDNIKDAIERATTAAEGSEQITYEAYGPGGAQLIIEAETNNRNKAAAEIRHILSKNGLDLAKPGAVVWAFTESRGDGGYREWSPASTMELAEEDQNKLERVLEELGENEEVREVFTNMNNV